MSNPSAAIFSASNHVSVKKAACCPWSDRNSYRAESSGIATGLRQTGDKPGANWINDVRENNRHIKRNPLQWHHVRTG
jgi:hypothetical protein